MWLEIKMEKSMKFGVVEVGSTVTKSFIYKDGELEELKDKTITFKKNYSKSGKLEDSDIEALNEVFKGFSEDIDVIYAYGTSTFRKLSETELDEFLGKLEDTRVKFRVVSSEEENEYTVKGVLYENDYNGRIAVVVGGGGSFEITFVENGEVIDKEYIDLGVMDIVEKFPDLAEDLVKTEFDVMRDYFMSYVKSKHNVDVLAMAGGNFIYFYEAIGYELQKNTLYENSRQPYMLNSKASDQYDRDVMKKSLDNIKKQEVGNEAWWDGARAMRVCMNALAEKFQAKYIVPTRINMLIGLISEIVGE